jgi:hypothetical protein
VETRVRFVRTRTLAEENKINTQFLVRYATGIEWEHNVYKYPKINFALTPSFQFNDEWKAFIELHGNAVKTFRPLVYIGSGIFYAGKTNLIFDLHYSYRISKKDLYRNTANMLYGIGASYRFIGGK